MDLSSCIEIPIKCPKCGHTIKKRLSDLQRQQDVSCICRTVISINPDGFKSAGKALSDLEKVLSKFGK